MNDEREHTPLNGDEIRAAARTLANGGTVAFGRLTRAEVAEILKFLGALLWWKRRNLPALTENTDALTEGEAAVFLDKIEISPRAFLRELLQEPLVLGLLATLAAACGLRLTLNAPTGFQP